MACHPARQLHTNYVTPLAVQTTTLLTIARSDASIVPDLLVDPGRVEVLSKWGDTTQTRPSPQEPIAIAAVPLVSSSSGVIP